MTDKSTTYWNSLLEKYKENTISESERFELEKRALDDPFLFDALEGFANLNDTKTIDLIEAQKANATGNKSKIFTLPRIASVASLIVLISMIFLMKQDDKVSNKKGDQSIAMVIDQEKNTINTTNQPKPLKDQPTESLNENSNTTLEQVESAPNNTTKKDALPNAVEKLNNAASSDMQTPATSTEVAQYPQNGKALKAEQKPSTSEDIIAKEDDIPSSIATKTKKRAVDLKNTNENENQDISAMETADTNMDDLNIPTVKEKVQLIDDKIFYIVEPMIGKADFDDYVEQRIKARGLHKSPTQEVIIEFNIDSEGNLSDFIHLNSTCSECGPFAISILQTSGVWKTTPKGMAGKARYSFMF